MGSKILTASDILAADDLKLLGVDIPEWGGRVYVRTMTGAERDWWEQTIVESGKSGKMANIRATLVMLTAVDEKGERIFNDTQIEVLGNKSAKALDRLFAAAQKLNAVTAADVEELEGN